MRKKLLVAGIILSTIGLGVASLSLSEYLHIQKAGLEEPSVCAVNETINCDIVNASSYAALFGIPTAAWGLLFYITIIAFALFIRFSKSEREASTSFVWALSLFGLAWSLRMAYVSVFILNAICVTCLAQYVINAILAVVLTFSFTLSFRERIGAIFSKKIFGPALTAAIIFGIGYVFALSAVKGGADDLSSTDIKSAVNAYYRQSLYGINPEDLKDAPYWGNKDAKVTIVEFSDFQCPFCRIAAFNIKPYLYEFKDKVKFVFVNYPLDNSCNKYMQGPMHQSACIAAEAVTCAGEKGKFWELHDLIFRNQKDLSLDKMIELGEKAGLDKDWLTACMGSGNAKAKVLNDIELAHKIYLTGTPSVFINNRILRLWRSPEVLRAIIKEEIKKNY